MTSLHTARSRLAQLRNQLHDQLATLKSGSTLFKQTKGRIGGVMDAIEICDQELLAQEQGEPMELRPDQVAWLNERRGECQHEWEYNQIHDSRRCHKCRTMQTNL